MIFVVTLSVVECEREIKLNACWERRERGLEGLDNVWLAQSPKPCATRSSSARTSRTLRCYLFKLSIIRTSTRCYYVYILHIHFSPFYLILWCHLVISYTYDHQICLRPSTCRVSLTKSILLLPNSQRCRFLLQLQFPAIYHSSDKSAILLYWKYTLSAKDVLNLKFLQFLDFLIDLCYYMCYLVKHFEIIFLLLCYKLLNHFTLLICWTS